MSSHVKDTQDHCFEVIIGDLHFITCQAILSDSKTHKQNDIKLTSFTIAFLLKENLDGVNIPHLKVVIKNFLKYLQLEEEFNCLICLELLKIKNQNDSFMSFFKEDLKILNQSPLTKNSYGDFYKKRREDFEKFESNCVLYILVKNLFQCIENGEILKSPSMPMVSFH